VHRLATGPAAGPSLSLAQHLDKRGITTSSISIELKNTSDDDPDFPLPSVEQEVLPSSSRENMPSILSDIAHETITSKTSEQGSIQARIDAVSDLTLNVTNTAESLERTNPAPSIRISPSISSVDYAIESNRLAADFASLRMEPHEDAGIPDASRLRETPSPSPSRRRRSGTGLARVIHRVENEKPPLTPFHKAEVQQALTDVESAVSTIVDVLSSSRLHTESGSAIQSLHTQALNLTRLQLPSSRIVGLIGDSGVGKSSLINSLLDKVDLARAVCSYSRLGSYATNLTLNRAAAALLAHVLSQSTSSMTEMTSPFTLSTSLWTS
jgi:hypothetical protein